MLPLRIINKINELKAIHNSEDWLMAKPKLRIINKINELKAIHNDILRSASICLTANHQ